MTSTSNYYTKNLAKYPKTWVHTARLKPANPRPAHLIHDSNEASTDLDNDIYKPLKPYPIIHNWANFCSSCVLITGLCKEV